VSKDMMKWETGADYLVAFLKAQGMDVLHNYPGGTIAPILDACVREDIAIYTSRHEQGAGYAALAQSRLTQATGVVAVTSGPGVTNLVTVVADAYFDGIPLVVLTGQVGTQDLRKDLPVRQRGFQEVDTPQVMGSIAKKVFQPTSVEQIPEMVEEAWLLSTSGRPGPVVLDLPMDIQRKPLQACSPRNLASSPSCFNEAAAADFLGELVQSIGQAKRPVLILGQGVNNDRSSKLLLDLLARWPAAVSCSLSGIGAVDTKHPSVLGFHGHTGSQLAGKAIYSADLLLVLGSRLDIRQTGTRTNEFAPSAKIFRVDVDQGELETSRVTLDKALVADTAEFLSALIKQLPEQSIDLSDWHQQLALWREEFPWIKQRLPGICPEELIRTLSENVKGQVVCVTGVGAHQHWVARHFRFHRPERILLTSAGHGAMGYDLPVAIGAALHCPDHKILCVVGDGSLQMNIQELGALVEHNLDVSLIVLDNQRLGLVSQFQLMNWPEDTACGERQSPDFVAIAQAYGISTRCISEADQILAASHWLVSTDGPKLLHVAIDAKHDILPMLLGGQRIDAMWPYYNADGSINAEDSFEGRD